MDEDDEQPPFTGAVILCPVCCSAVDAEKWGPQTHECITCTTVFTLDLKADVVAAHATVG